MTSNARSVLAFAPLALGLAALLGSGALAERVPEAELRLWRLLAMQLCWVGLATATARALGGSLRERLGLQRARLEPASLALGALGLLALSGALHFAIAARGLRDSGALARIDALVQAAGPQSPLLVFLAMDVAPAFGEEMLFRGLLQRSLAARFGALAIPLAAAAFGLLHQDPVHSPAAFVMGCYLGALAFLSGSTWTAVLCHLANNAAGTLQQLLAAPLPAPQGALSASLWAAASAICLAASWLVLRRRGSPSRPSG